ncbi:uncharacterized protein LOC113343651 [Papaver somniferum]|uniref:uncharacterized protein LOC113343651 n=1 Tax=Papaver somniferum TaxID=3469 RepID=UPI000E6F6BF3|nr:uncharacterized protein LOC113343651 [Papaver somniferum]
MRVFYWNAQGLAKDGERAKLKELYHLHKPDVICIAEPKVFCTTRFVRSLRLDDFSDDVITNEVVGEKGNIWVLWRNYLARPGILSSSKQAITLNFDGDWITAVHASCDPAARRNLWQQLGLGFVSVPWLVLGDFNCILRLDEKKGGRSILSIYMNEFRSWISDNGLVEADSIGKKYTWSNCQSGDRRIVSRNDRAVVNDAWNYKYENWRCKSLPRICSDHSPLFGYAFDSPRPARAPFRIQKMWLDHPRFMQLVKDNWNLPFYGAPPFVFAGKLKHAEDEFQFTKVADAQKEVDEVRTDLAVMLKLKSRVTWLEDGDQNTRFFRNRIRMRRRQNTISELKISSNSTLVLQDEIKYYIVNHYKEKFNGGAVDIDPKLFDISHDRISTSECSFMDAIPSLEEIKRAVFDLGADSAPGPDGFSGSFYRHCWNIIADDLLGAIKNCWLMRKIPNGINSSFIVLIPKNSRSDAIKDFRPIGLSNFFFKIITKILATRLGTVLNRLISEEQVAFMKGRNIHENIALASELINEISAPRNFGNVGLKLDIAQAFDTVSWDFIAEVFRQYGFSETWCSWIHSILRSARISVLINGSHEGFFSITIGLRQGDPLSPLIFMLIEDILSLNLSKLFANRSMHSMVSKKGVAPTHLLFADDILVFCRGPLLLRTIWGMERAIFPDKYLGIQPKPGIVRHIHVRQVVEKIMDKLAGWKGKLLSFQDRLVLIRSVIASYVIHSMDIYKWPASIIKQVERAIRNFLWSGDAEKHKYFTVLYDILCCSRREGGLGLKKLIDVNKAMLMKLWISICDSNKTWARFLRAKYFKLNGVLIDYKLGSTVFPGIRWVYDFVQHHTRSITGNGSNTSLFFDNWLGDFSIARRLGITSKGPNDFKAKVSDIIVDGAWVIPHNLRILLVRLNIDVDNLPIIGGGEDYKVWDLDSKGVFSVKSAKGAIREPAEVLPITTLFSRPVVHPTLSAQYWKVWAKQCCASDDNVIKKTGRSMPSMCRFCRHDCETLSHITWHCRFAKRIWAWVDRIFNLQPREDLVASYKAAKGRSRMIKDLWLVANLAIPTELWRLRNKVYFEDKEVSWLGFKGRVYQVIRDNSIRLKGHMYNNMEDLRILNYFKVKHRSCKISYPIEVRWDPPFQGEMMICCDGASLGNPGPAGAGVTFRDANAAVLGVLSVGLGLQTNYFAEVYTVIYGAMLAKRWNMRKICVQSDSMSCIQAFQNDALPWKLRQKWSLARNFYSNIRFIHKYREVNFLADASAKQACLLAEDIFEFSEGRPISMLSVEWPGEVYFRFK